MKKTVLFLMALFAVQTAMAIDHVIITEVLYDPATTETGTEAVQIYNPTESAVDISGWTVKTGSSAADATIPQNTLIQPGQHYLIADVGWSQYKMESWPLANYEEAITITNTDSGIAIARNTTIMDAVGWGTNANIAEGLYEGTPANTSGEGKSLQRKKADGVYLDTNNNQNDFFSAAPSFTASQAGNGITVIAVVSGAAPDISKITITDDDEIAAGFQITPNPGKNKTATVTAYVSDANGAGDINNVLLSFGSTSQQMAKTADINATTARFEANLSLTFYLAKGNYTITIKATDSAQLNTTKTALFEYQGIVAMELDSSTVTFNAMPGTTAELKGDTDTNTNNITIRNTGNTPLNLKLSGTNLAAGQNTIPVEKLQYSFGSNSYKPLSFLQQTEQLGLNPDAKEKLSLALTVPTGTTPGNYTGRISIIAVA